MIIAAIVVSSLLAYLWIGWRFIGPRYVLRQMNHHIERYPSLCTERELKRYRGEYQAEAWGPIVAWPLCLLVWLPTGKLTGKLTVRAPLTSLEIERRDRAQQVRIAELERELGIGGKR